MKLAASGRILLWSGGSLWIGRAGEPTGLHSHHAVQIALAFSPDGVRFRRSEADWNSYHAAIIAAHQPHAFDGRGNNVATIFVEPESREGQVLQQRCRADGIVAVAAGALEAETKALSAAYNNVAADAVLVAAARCAISRLAATGNTAPVTLDPRIKRTLERIRQRLGDNILLAEMADIACLSPDRFRHLFLEQTGIRFRPYVLWLRIEVALAAYTANKSLTEAAHAGGFADSAHFSRTFKSMFGIAPSSIQLE